MDLAKSMQQFAWVLICLEKWNFSIRWSLLSSIDTRDAEVFYNEALIQTFFGSNMGVLCAKFVMVLPCEISVYFTSCLYSDRSKSWAKIMWNELRIYMIFYLIYEFGPGIQYHWPSEIYLEWFRLLVQHSDICMVYYDRQLTI